MKNDKEYRALFSSKCKDVTNDGFDERITKSLPQKASNSYAPIFIHLVLIGVIYLVAYISGAAGLIMDNISLLTTSIMNSEIPTLESFMSLVIITIVSSSISYSLYYVIDN